MDIIKLPTPKQFLKNRRPEQFSSSEEVIINQLDRVYLEYYLSNLNTKSKELEFETFVKEICQKTICPNLLEQTGPVAGGDGKTDTQTFPVSEQNKLLWYVGINSNANSDRWAFAISTQKTWKPKCKNDVKKIVETQRGYTQIFCITNQLIKADQRSKLEDELSSQYGIQVCILDLSWLLDETYKNKLEQIAIDTLQIPTNFKREISLSPEDYSKKQRFEKLIVQINSDINPNEFTFDQVDIFLDIAELSKQLENPVFETQGLYDRAVKIAQRFGTTNQIFQAYYNYARASYYWHEDFVTFQLNFKSTYKTISESSNAILWADFVTLLVIQISHRHRDEEQNTGAVDDIVTDTIIKLNEIIKDKSRPSNALQAEIALTQLQLVQNFSNNDKMDEIFKKIQMICQQGEYLIGFPFENIYGFIDELDDIFHDYPNYQALQDYLTAQSIKRNGDLKTSKVALERGVRQAEVGNYYRAIKLIGKTLLGLNKEEALKEMIYANMALAHIYSQVDLHWAGRANLLRSASMLTDYWYKHKVVLPSTIKAYFSLVREELLIGRIAQALIWLELALIFIQQSNDEYIDSNKTQNIDACIAHLLLNCNLDAVRELEYLVDEFDKFGLVTSEIALLYVLGYEDKIKSILEWGVDEELHDYMILIRDCDIGHPHSKTLSMVSRYNSYSIRILGCEVIVLFPNKTPFIELVESIISSLECFLATALIDGIIAKTPIIHIDISSFEDSENIISHEYIVNDRGTVFEILCHPFLWEDLNQNNKPIIGEWFMFFIADFVDRGFLIKDSKMTLEKLITEDKIFARSMMFETCLGAIYNILGKNSHNDLLEKLTQGTHYPLLRKTPWDIDDPKEVIIDTEVMKIGNHEDKPVFDMEKHTHNQIAMTTLIRPEFWDPVTWRGLGFDYGNSQPPFMFFLFKERQLGLRIFNDLVKQLSTEDKNEKLRISILRGINKDSPAHYRIILSENLQKSNNSKILTMFTPKCTMQPNSDLNWKKFEQSYHEYGSFQLAPAFISNTSSYPDVELGLVISKKQLIVKNAWEVGINDIERVAIYPEDNIFVPEGVVDPPFLKILEHKGS